MPQLSERGTLIIPVERAALAFLRESLALGELGLVPKAEHHFTVFGFSIGKHIHKARGVLGAWLDAEAEKWDWGFTLGRQCFHLRQPAPRALDTVVVRIEAKIAEFFARAEAEARARGVSAELVAALAAPPPPHITLYTSDPEGKAGIGLNRVADLEAAIARGKAGDAGGLQAWEVAAEVILGR